MRLNAFILLCIPFFALNLTAQNWQTDFETAKNLATNQDKTILLVFQGSDWCAPCIKLDREVLETQTFTDFADQSLIMLQADFPRKKKNALSKTQQEKNSQLAEEYNRYGYFPYAVLLSSTGIVLGSFGYESKPVLDYINSIRQIIEG